MNKVAFKVLGYILGAGTHNCNISKNKIAGRLQSGNLFY
jgi:hypothetical protein